MRLMGFVLAEGGEPEVERMTAATAKVFGPFVPNFIANDLVAKKHARQRMPDYLHGGL